MNNILMTGTQGCVGSRLKEVFTEKGYNVTEFAGDIRYPGAWENYKTMKWDGLIHLAAIAGVRRSFSHPEEYYDNNVNGTSSLSITGNSLRNSPFSHVEMADSKGRPGSMYCRHYLCIYSWYERSGDTY